MVRKYDRLRAEGRISAEEKSCLEDEKTTLGRRREQLKVLLAQALHSGCAIFRGVRQDASALGPDFAHAAARWLDGVLPALYPKLEMGARPLTGKEPEEVLKAVNLAGLPDVCYADNDGLGLVVREGDRLVPNPEAPAAREVLGHLQRQAAYGERVAGRDLEHHFRANGFGWESDLLRLVLAVLLRAGRIELTHQGQTLRGYQDPACRTVLGSVNAFRAASFAPREGQLTNKDLVEAARRYEELTGQEVDPDTAVISREVGAVAVAEWERLLPVLATAEAEGLPVASVLREYRDVLQPLRPAGAQDAEEVIRHFLGEAQTLRTARARVQRIAAGLSGPNLERLRAARGVLKSLWPELQRTAQEEEPAEAARRLEDLLADADVCERLAEVEAAADLIRQRYAQIYAERHAARAAAYQEAMDDLRSRPDWLALQAADQEEVLAPLTKRACADLDRDLQETACRRCGASLQKMADDMQLLSTLRGTALARLQQLARPQVRIEHVTVGALLSGPLDSPEAVESALSRLREHLLRLIETGVQVILE